MKCLSLAGSLIVALLVAAPLAAEDKEGWTMLSNGKDMTGWKPNERPEAWKVEDGAFVAHGERSHLFYNGDEKPFKNFEFQCEVKTLKGSNGGICFHTAWVTDTWPTLKQGFESQVANTHGDPQKTGGLYNVVKVNPSPAKDDEWWTHYIKVDGKHIVVKINDKTVVDYTEPEKLDPKQTQRVGEGSFCLQAHDPNSTVYYRNIKVRRLP